MSIQTFNRRIDGIIKNKSMLNKSTLNQHRKQDDPDYLKSFAGAIVSVCDMSEESALILADRICNIPPCEINMNTSDIFTFLKKEHGYEF